MQPQRGSRGGAPGSGEQRVNVEGSPGLFCSRAPGLGWGKSTPPFPAARPLHTDLLSPREPLPHPPPPARSCERPRVCGRVCARALGACGGRFSEPQARAQEAIRRARGPSCLGAAVGAAGPCGPSPEGAWWGRGVPQGAWLWPGAGLSPGRGQFGELV